MTLAIVASLISRQAADRDNLKSQDLLQRQTAFIMRMAVAQAVVASTLDGEKKAEFLKMVENEFHMLESRPVKDPAVTVQKFIILSFLGKPPQRDDALTSSGNRLYLDYENLYFHGTSPVEDSPLFALPAGELAKLKVMDDIKSKHAMQDMQSKYVFQQNVLFILFYGTIFIFLTGIAFVIHQIQNKPQPLYIQTLNIIPPGYHSVLIETAILYLFLMFPVGSFAAIFLPESLRMVFHLVWLPGVFAASILYLRKNMDGYPISALFFDSDLKILKEWLAGLSGFLIIFPLALAALLFTAIISGQQSGDVRFAHPIVFELKEHPILTLILASVVVPILEEVIFRAFIYGYFRTLTRIRYAAFFTGFIFAALHPQGAIALPYLTVLGAGLCVLREYRPGILAPIITHSLVNTLALGVAYYMLYL